MTQRRSHGAALALLLAALLLAQPVVAGTISLSWDAVSHPDLAGYRVYIGNGSGTFPQSVDVGLVTSATLSGLQDCTTYAVGVKGYDSTGDESATMSDVLSGWARPEILAVSPASIEQNEQQILVLSGRNFQQGATVSFSNPAIAVQSVSWTSCQELRVTVQVSASASQGAVALEVVNPDEVFGAASGLLSVAGDATPPDIEELTASDVGATSAHVVWSTEEPATSTLFYRRQGETTYHQVGDATFVTEHEIVLQGLEPETIYEFHVASADASGNQAGSDVDSFTTLVSSDDYLRFEAEMGALSTPVQGVAEPAAFRGGAILLPVGTASGTAANPAGGATFGFHVPATGTWRVWVRVHTSDSQGRSWFERVDGAVAAPLATATVGQWTWVGGRSYQLSEGLHAFALGGYRAASRADRVLITDDPDFVPTEEPGDDKTAPPQVTGATIESAESESELSWTAPASADARKIVIRYRTDATFPATPVDGLPLTEQVLTPGVGGSHAHSGLVNGTTYRYALFTLDDSGNASIAVQLQATPQDSLPGPVTNVERTDKK